MYLSTAIPRNLTHDGVLMLHGLFVLIISWRKSGKHDESDIKLREF